MKVRKLKYKIVEMFDNKNKRKTHYVMGINNNKYVGKWYNQIEKAEEELFELMSPK